MLERGDGSRVAFSAGLRKERRVKTRSYAAVQAEPEWRGASSAADSELERIRRSVEFVGRLSDGIIRIGPWGLGLDGLLAWVPIPGVGEAYSALAGAFILVQGARAKVPLHILIVAAALLAGNTLIEVIPVGGAAVSDVFLAHRWAAGMVCKAIERRMARGDR
jgi:hypothetical protein